MDYLNIDHLKRIATWGKIVGAASIIMGAISIVLTLTVDPTRNALSAHANPQFRLCDT
ncbi:hypothetical protein [Oceanobacillus sp. FSL K6-0251]|uniref:hypothetical protein n=1 Tax=Oceanobacillus sp. FSL K6-0251 TaxID=2921602 RepID=UPI0030F54805